MPNKIDGSINGYPFRPKYLDIEYKVTGDGDISNRLIILTEESDPITIFCKDGDPIEIQWQTRNESATLARHESQCRFESCRLTNEATVNPKSGDPDKYLLESIWQIIRWKVSF